MFSNRRLGGMVGLGLGALYAWRNRSRFSGFGSRFGRSGHIGSEYVGSEKANVDSSQDLSNSNISSGNKQSGAV